MLHISHVHTGGKRHLPQQHRPAKEQLADGKKVADVEEAPPQKKCEALMEVALSVRQVLSNASFVFLMLAATTENGATYGFAAFFPKLLQFQFGQSPTSAGLFAGRRGHDVSPFISLIMTSLQVTYLHHLYQLFGIH